MAIFDPNHFRRKYTAYQMTNLLDARDCETLPVGRQYSNQIKWVYVVAWSAEEQ